MRFGTSRCHFSISAGAEDGVGQPGHGAPSSALALDRTTSTGKTMTLLINLAKGSGYDPEWAVLRPSTAVLGLHPEHFTI